VRGGEAVHLGGVVGHALLEQGEAEAGAVEDHELPIDDRPRGQDGARGGGDLGEAVGEVGALPGPQPRPCRGGDDDEAEPVPLELVDAPPG